MTLRDIIPTSDKKTAKTLMMGGERNPKQTPAAMLFMALCRQTAHTHEFYVNYLVTFISMFYFGLITKVIKRATPISFCYWYPVVMRSSHNRPYYGSVRPSVRPSVRLSVCLSVPQGLLTGKPKNAKKQKK